MGKLGVFGKVFAFIVGGFIAIIVGCFMLRGTMHLWDKNDVKLKDGKKINQPDD